MKKIIALLLALVMVLSLCACGKSQAAQDAETAISAIGEVSEASENAIINAEKLYGILTDKEKEQVENRMVLVNARDAFDKIQAEIAEKQAKEVYDNAMEAYNLINSAADICIAGMDDIYGAWHYGIYNLKSSNNVSLWFDMAEETPNMTFMDFVDASTQTGITSPDVMKDWQKCILIVLAVFESRGDYDTISETMATAETVMQKLTNEYEDYTYYPKLKEYYSIVGSYIEFFKNPTGSFDQAKDTINEYENNIRTYQTDLNFLFSK